MITLALEKQLTSTNEEMTQTNVHDESADEDVFKTTDTDGKVNENNDASDTEIDIFAPSTSRILTTTPIEMDNTDSASQGNILKKSGHNKRKKIIRAVSSDSEDEYEAEKENIFETDYVKRNRTLSDSDNDSKDSKPKMKKTRILDSDEED